MPGVGTAGTTGGGLDGEVGLVGLRGPISPLVFTSFDASGILMGIGWSVTVRISTGKLFIQVSIS